VLVYVGLDRLGDGLLKLPFVRGLREAFPEARITWVAGKETSVYAGAMASLVAGLLDEVIENANIGNSPWELLRRPLKGRRFDLVIDTQRIVWKTLMLRRIPHRAFVSPCAGFLLSSRRPPRGYRRPRSLQRQLLDLLELASGRRFATPARIEIDLDPGLVEEAKRLLPDGPVYVGIAPGTGGPPKRWPLANFLAIARAQLARGRVPVFVLGPMEKDWRAEIAGALPEALFPLQAEGVEARHRFSPLLTIALASRLAVGVANDSGVAHMFAVGGAPLVVVYGGPGPDKFVPVTDRLAILPAAQFGGWVVADVPVAAVERAAERLLAGEPA
jgi:ADP-heptose:LPS heptosyltransferase